MTRRTGLSLVELTITMLVIGILAAVGSLKYADLLAEHRAEMCRQIVLENLQAAQQGARTRSTSVTVTFQKNKSTYTITGLPNPNHPSKPYVQNMADTAAGMQASNNYTVTFNGFGYPTANVVIELKGAGRKTYLHVNRDGSMKITF